LGLATTLHAVPFQFSVRVCGLMVPAGVKEPTAQTLFAAFDVVTPVRLARWPGDGLGTALGEARVPGNARRAGSVQYP
jgi:hypothetical protein